MPSRKQSSKRTARRNMDRTQVSRVNPWATGGSAPEIKYYTKAVNNLQLYHNGFALYDNQNLLQAIPFGTGVDQRIGSKIFVKSLAINFVLNNKTDRPNVSYRIIVAATPSTGNTDTFAEIAAAGFTGVPFPSQAQILHDAMFPLNQGSGMENNVTPNKERSFLHRLDIPINRPVTYDRLDGNLCNSRIHVYVSAYDAFATLTTDNIASVAQSSYRIMFSDA